MDPTHINSIPSEIIELIVYLLDNESLYNLNEAYPLINLNWGTVFKYRYGKYKMIEYREYYRYISVEKFKEQGEDIEDLLNIKQLDLYSSQIVKIPKGVGQFSKLKYLFLNNNQMKLVN